MEPSPFSRIRVISYCQPSRAATRRRHSGTGGHCATENIGLMIGNDPGRHVVGQREDRDRGFADGKGRGGNNRWQKTFKPLTRFGKLRRHPGVPRMDLCTDMVGHQPDDALTIGGRQPLPRIGHPL